MCLALIDGRAWTVVELAAHADVARSTASEHATALVEAGLLVQERQGRHRYLRLAAPDVAAMVENLVGAVGHPAPRPFSLRGVRAARDLAAARTCYDHLAGTLGVSLYDGLVANDLLDASAGLALTPAGRDWFAELAGETALRPRGARPLIRTCLDWTERRHHLSGTLGAVLHEQLSERGWVVPSARHRAVTLTDAGAKALHDLLRLDRHPPMTAAHTAG
jgi:DNA-binding transcriptional ArsR family regulator